MVIRDPNQAFKHRNMYIPDGCLGVVCTYCGLEDIVSIKAWRILGPNDVVRCNKCGHYNTTEPRKDVMT